LIESIASTAGVKKICFSGGVLQNALLVDLIIDTLGQEFQLFFHQRLSPNDECISFGQLAMLHLSVANEQLQLKEDSILNL
jgi:hydrogenase maturation protein HypF